MKPKQYKILKNCATERQTYFGGEVVQSPSEVDPELVKNWVEDGIAEPIEPEEKKGKSVNEKKFTLDIQDSDLQIGDDQ